MLLTCIVFLALTGCLAPKPEEVIALTWWVTFALDSDQYLALQTIAEGYTEKTGHAVDLVSVPWDDIAPRGFAASRLAIEQESGRGPDVWGPVPHNWTGAFAGQNQVLPLEMNQIQASYQYVGSALQACQFDGKQYALPVLIDSVALIYNRALISDPPTSFEELLDLARDLVDTEHDRWGLVLPLLSQYHTYPFIDGYGGYIFKCERDQCDVGDIGLNNEGAVQGIRFLSDLYVKERLFPEALADRAVMHSHAVRLFTEGKAGMLIDGSWVLPDIRASSVEYGVAVIPKLPGTTDYPRPLTLVQAVFASAHTSHPDEAVDLLNHIASPDSVLAMHDVWGKTPVRRDVLGSADFRESHHASAWSDQATIGVPLPNVPELDYVWTPWARALDEAIPGLTPAQDVLDSAVEQIKGYLEDD